MLLTLRGRLLVALLVPLGALALIGATLDYLTARRLTGEAHDRLLTSTAAGLAARLETDRDNDLPDHLVTVMRTVGRSNGGGGLHYWVRDSRGRTISGDERLEATLDLADGEKPSFVDAELAGRPVRAVVYRYSGRDGQATIVVAETLDGRRKEATQMLAITAAVNLAMAVSVALAAYVAVRFALWPLDALGARVSGLEVQSLRPIPSRGLPAETRPLVRAINGLMRRLRLTFRAREAFINDTAHQLRTPLAALSAQVDLLGQLDLSPDLRRRVGDVAGSVQRLVHLANQLLALARADEQASAVTRMQTVDLPELLQEVASACLDTALEKGVDLGFEPAPANVTGAPALLLEMLKNLVDNAIVHSPAGTTVTVRCGTVEGLEETYLEVEDDGPGIAAADRSRVFDRYVRLKPGKAPGTGLGLAIVREIALRHGAEVQIQDGAGGRGTRVRVSFGATRQPPPM